MNGLATTATTASCSLPLDAASESKILGRSLLSLLDEGCDRTPNAHAFNQWTKKGWRSLSNSDVRAQVEHVALGLLNLGLKAGDRVAMLMHGGTDFCTVDFGCLLAHLVNVPLDLTQTIEHLIAAVRHCDAKALVVSNLDLLAQIVPYLVDAPALRYVILADVPANWSQTRSEWVATDREPVVSYPPPGNCLQIPMVFHPAPQPLPSVFPHCIQLLSLDEVMASKALESSSSNQLQHLRTTMSPQDLATIVYVPDEFDRPQGVMLTHENLAGNALASFSCISHLGNGAQERVVSFLPLNHVLARTLLYGHICRGHSIYFTGPNRLMKHLTEIRPTVLTTVPIVLEKIYEKWVEFATPSSATPANSRTQAKRLHRLFGIGQGLFGMWMRSIGAWALNLARRYPTEPLRPGWYGLQHRLADWLVFSRWRSPLGGHLNYLICGGAALSPEVATVFAAAGMPVMQGYGLTQASAVVCFNRGSENHPGTVGKPIPAVEVAIAPDGEILVRSPYVTPGYYRNPATTQILIDAQGWLHTGDLGEFTDAGFLKITGVKKALFKLSTGKYIAPQPIEQRLKQSIFVRDALVVGSDRKFCAALIAPNWLALQRYVQSSDPSILVHQTEALLQHACIRTLYQSVVDAANCHLPYWSMIKHFQLVDFSPTHGSLVPLAAGKINRAAVTAAFAQTIDALYGNLDRVHRTAEPFSSSHHEAASAICPPTPAPSCPTIAQSLSPRLTTLNTVAPLIVALSPLLHRMHIGVYC